MNTENPMNSSLSIVYLFLLNYWDKNGQNDFELSDTFVSKQLKLNRNTIKSSKKELRDLGLISYQISNGMPTFYKIIVDYTINRKAVPIKEKATKKIVEVEKIIPTQGVNQLNKNAAQEKNHTKQEKPAIVSKIETPSENIPITENISTQPIAVVSNPIVKKVAENKNIPSLEEFMEFAKTIEIYNENLDFEIKAKYETWLENGWATGFNKPIINWKQSLRNTMPYMAGNSKNKPNTIFSIPKINRPKTTYNE